MLLAEYVVQYLVHCCLRGCLVKDFSVPLLARKIIYLGIDCVYTLFIKLPFAGEDGLAACCEQYIVVKRGDKELAPPVEELGAQINP